MISAHLSAVRSTCDRGPELLFDKGRHGVGCVVVRENRIVAGGYSGSPPGEPHCDEYICRKCKQTGSTKESVKHSMKVPFHYQKGELLDLSLSDLSEFVDGGHMMVDGHCVRTLHAEENAILQAALDGTSLLGTTFYTTASPCWDCAKRMIRVGATRVYFGGEYDSRYDLSEKALVLLGRSNIRHAEIDVSSHFRLTMDD